MHLLIVNNKDAFMGSNTCNYKLRSSFTMSPKINCFHPMVDNRFEVKYLNAINESLVGDDGRIECSIDGPDTPIMHQDWPKMVKEAAIQAKTITTDLYTMNDVDYQYDKAHERKKKSIHPQTFLNISYGRDSKYNVVRRKDRVTY